MSQAPLLVIEGLTFQYRRGVEPALRDVSLRLDPGEILLVAGPSGCGKSTLIRAVNGLIPHSYRGKMAGTVRLAGRATTEVRLRDLAAIVGTVLQDPRRQLVASTVQAELAFGPENLGFPPAQIGSMLTQVAAVAEIGHLLERSVDELSGGEAQLVAVAGALILQPKVLVLDEPLANLDPATARRLLEMVRRLADRGTATIIVEHRVEDVLAVEPDRVAYLEAGQLRYLGDVTGFLEVADPESVKLPFEIVLRQAGAPSPKAVAHPRRTRRSTAGQPGPRLEWRGVDAGYDDHQVLYSVSATLDSQQTVAVLGPNGSGKTTLFKAAIGLVPLTAGDVLVDARSTRGRSVADLVETFGYVFQNPSQMLFAPTVREELLFGPMNLGRDPATFDAIVQTSLLRVRLVDEAEIASRPPLTLSFGQQKRLAIAVALALEPRTLVLDEPSAGQDYRSATAFMEEIARIESLDSTYFITHDVDLALTYADRVLLVRDGRIVADGPPLEVIADRQRWHDCNLRVSSLMEANARWGSQTGQFMGAAELANWVRRHST